MTSTQHIAAMLKDEETARLLIFANKTDRHVTLYRVVDNQTFYIGSFENENAVCPANMQQTHTMDPAGETILTGLAAQAIVRLFAMAANDEYKKLYGTPLLPS